MPIYEYRCGQCGEFSALRSLLDYNAPMQCPECADVAVKIFSVPNINLNSRSFSAIDKINSAEPKLVKGKATKPTKPKYQQVRGNRPWMISHAPARF